MEQKLSYKPSGVCSSQIDVVVTDGIVSGVKFTGGCHGNAQGVGALACGMSVEEVIAKLKGIDCKGRGTSCPDQLTHALEQACEK